MTQNLVTKEMMKYALQNSGGGWNGRIVYVFGTVEISPIIGDTTGTIEFVLPIPDTVTISTEAELYDYMQSIGMTAYDGPDIPATGLFKLVSGDTLYVLRRLTLSANRKLYFLISPIGGTNYSGASADSTNLTIKTMNIFNLEES